MTTQTAKQSFVHFHELSLPEQTVEIERLQAYREIERPLFDGAPLIPHMDAADFLISAGKLVLVEPDENLFGIARPVRDRAILPKTDAEGSIPYLTPHALAVVQDMLSDIKLTSKDHELVDVLAEFGYDNFRMSLTSLTRTAYHQALIASEGKLAVGVDGKDEHSTHETGQTVDIDHTGFYVRSDDGEEVPMNPASGNPEQHLRLRPLFKQLLGSVVELYQEEGLVVALDEVPNGWGVYHVAVLPA